MKYSEKRRTWQTSLLVVALIPLLIANTPSVMAKLRFTRVDLERLASAVEWTPDRPATLDVLEHWHRGEGATHYVAVEIAPTTDLTQAFVLACDAQGKVLRAFPTDEHFGKWQFISLQPGHDALVISGGGGAHVYEHVWIYSLTKQDAPKDLLFDAIGAAVRVEEQNGQMLITRYFDQMGGGSSNTRNVYRWDGKEFTFDSKLSNGPEEAYDQVMARE